jgi:hypothetical protein
MNKNVIDIRDSVLEIPGFSELVRNRPEKSKSPEPEKQMLKEDESNALDEVETSDDQPDYSAMPLPFKDNNKGGTLTRKPKKYEDNESDEDERPPTPPKKGKKPKPKKTVVVESDDDESEPMSASQAYYGLYEYSDKYIGDKSTRKFSIIKVVNTDGTDKRLLPSGLGCTSFTGAKKAEIDSLVKKLYSITKEFGKPPSKKLAERCEWIEKVMESLGLIMRDTNL